MTTACSGRRYSATTATGLIEMFTIARATENDVDAIKKVPSATWVDTYASYLSPSTIEQVTTEWHAPKLLRSQIERDTNYFAVAWLDGEMAQTSSLSSPWSGNWSRSHEH